MRQLTGQDIIAGADSCLKHGSHIIAVTLGKVMRLELGKGTSHRTAMAVGYLRDAENEYTIESTGHDIAGDIVARFSITKLGTRQGFPTFDKLARSSLPRALFETTIRFTLLLACPQLHQPRLLLLLACPQLHQP